MFMFALFFGVFLSLFPLGVGGLFSGWFALSVTPVGVCVGVRMARVLLRGGLRRMSLVVLDFLPSMDYILGDSPLSVVCTGYSIF